MVVREAYLHEFGHDSVIPWLLEGDPSIRWQVQRDLMDAPPAQWLGEQRRVAAHGWGARLLSYRDAGGRWTPRLYGKKWLSTTYSLLLLRRLGLSRHEERAAESCLLFLAEGLWPDGWINLSRTIKRSETCITGMVLGLLSWFGVEDPRRERLTGYLLNEQLPDGGWNCQRYLGATHGSFHTTINVLEGLRDYVEAGGARTREVLEAEARGREFFLQHGLYRSHRTGEIVNSAFTLFSFPPRWHHDILRTLDYFRSAAAGYDSRLEDPLALVRHRQNREGKWVLQNRHPGSTYFEMEKPGRPSRWNTLRALRVLKWRAAPAAGKVSRGRPQEQDE
jgi:hypothetical protein